MNNKITLRSWAGKVKEYRFYPLPGKNGARLPFVKPVRTNSDGSTEMILTDAERNSEASQYFIPEDMEIIVTDGTEFDLDDPLQKNMWECIKESDLIVPSRDAKDEHGNYKIDGDSARYGIAELWIDIPGEESRKSVNKKKLIRQAWDFIENDSVNGILTKCRLLGKVMTNAPITDVQDWLYDRASANPEEIINIYTDGKTKIKLLILDAREKGVIIRNNGLNMYADSVLGATDEAVIDYLTSPSNKAVFDLIKVATYPEYAKEVKPEKKSAK